MNIMTRRRYSIKNKYEIIDDYVVLYIKRKDGNNLKCLIDLDDLDKVKKFKTFHASWFKKINGYYIQTSVYLGTFNGIPRYQIVRLHHIIKPIKKGEIVDHKNHDTLDNRKENLEVVDKTTNAINRLGANKNSSTGVRNVSYSKNDNKYVVQLQVNGKNTRFGRFDNLEDAKECADYYREKIYGKVLNYL